jgi:ATP-dependent Clp protease ATP-binding subunit ClpC
MAEQQLPEIVQEVLEIARHEAGGAGAEAVEPVHLLIAICKQNSQIVADALAACGIDGVKLRRRVRGFAMRLAGGTPGEPRRVSGRVMHAIGEAQTLAVRSGRPVHPADLFTAILRSPDKTVEAVINGEELPVDRIVDALQQEKGRVAETSKAAKTAVSRTPFLDRFGKDYTALAREGRLQPVIGRREELKRIIRVLLRKQKNNPVLVGDAGVGKTAIVEGLALFASGPEAPPEIREMRIVEIPVAALVAGTKYRGDFEERIQKVVSEAEADPRIVLFFDEIHSLVGAGSGGEGGGGSDLLKPALARGALRCVGATTPAEYRRYIEPDPALERRLQPIRVEEPTIAETKEILAGLRPSYEQHHNVSIEDEALDAAVELSVKYLPDRRLPDKARDLIDQAAATKRLATLSPRDAESEKPLVSRGDIAAVVAEWTGVPLERLTMTQRDRLLAMDDALRKRVVGQDHAIDAVSRTVRTALTGLSQENRPHGVFLFLGPTGVGKTELAKALAEFLFDDERRLIRFDMSEYQEEHTVSKLIGSPPGYVGHDEGGRLTDAVRDHPYAVVLFDEIEKAHPKVSDLFLQIFDDGRLTDSRGRVADFRNTIIILTSNIAPDVHEPPKVGFMKAAGAEREADEALARALLGYFRPELLNRISQIVQFHPLGREQIRMIVSRIIAKIERRLADKAITLDMTNEALDRLLELGYRPEFGARELERVVEREIVQPLAEAILNGTVAPRTVVEVELVDGRFEFSGMQRGTETR